MEASPEPWQDAKAGVNYPSTEKAFWRNRLPNGHSSSTGRVPRQDTEIVNARHCQRAISTYQSYLRRSELGTVEPVPWITEPGYWDPTTRQASFGRKTASVQSRTNSAHLPNCRGCTI